MKTIVILLAVILSTPAFADEKRELILEMLEITQAKKNHELMVDAYVKQFSSNPVMATENFEKYFREAMSWDSIIDPVVEIYEDAYTVEELEYINEFYSSPIGQSFIKKAPQVNEKSSAVMMKNIQSAMQNLQPQ